MDFSANDIIERIKSKTSLKNLETIGITPQIISKWKSRNTIPRADDLYRIAVHLGVTMEWLLTGNETSLEQSELIYKQKYEKLYESLKDLIQNP